MSNPKAARQEKAQKYIDQAREQLEQAQAALQGIDQDVKEAATDLGLAISLTELPEVRGATNILATTARDDEDQDRPAVWHKLADCRNAIGWALKRLDEHDAARS